MIKFVKSLDLSRKSTSLFLMVALVLSLSGVACAALPAEGKSSRPAYLMENPEGLKDLFENPEGVVWQASEFQMDEPKKSELIDCILFTMDQILGHGRGAHNDALVAGEPDSTYAESLELFNPMAKLLAYIVTLDESDERALKRAHEELLFIMDVPEELLQ